jgi:replication-associated recombination protein RarA
MKNTKTFDDLFFKEKRVIIELVRKFMRKDITKLTLLLHGEPGLGKTSIIKAIANMTGYDIFRVKLQNVQSNIHLLDIFHSRTTIYSPNIESNNRMETCSSLDRIYILEDIDADGDLVHQRSNTVVKKKLDDKIQPEEKPNITLSDVLNCLDGVIENNHIIIMTTNYVEKLDSALIRPGRITYNLKMSRLTNVDVNNFIKRKYGNEANEISVPDYKISPATLESLFHICNTFQDLQQMIERII